MDTVNPNWTTSFTLDYMFEVSQEVLMNFATASICVIVSCDSWWCVPFIKKASPIQLPTKVNTHFLEKSVS